ncbi:cysteine protease StiP domain-containing protein [Deinococcus sonorensis]|uniref:Cysteine protease StiP domain-containing protein n=2 Tax=Deinococcus sonorensis TaxID=309891 RepID=A0AAU7UCR0_9DEIO
MSSGSAAGPAWAVAPFPTSYAPDDLTLWLARAAAPTVTLAEKEARIGAGESYGHFLTPEAAPTALQQATYQQTLDRNGPAIAADLKGLARQLEQHAGGHPLTLVSLARAGFPVGILLQRELRRRGLETVHGGLSIIRGVGLDRTALQQLLQARPGSRVVFVDGWTGKGSIRTTLRRSLDGSGVAPTLAALYDPAGVADLAGSHHDRLLPHAVLNATVSGLLSRTFLRPDGTHAAERLDHLEPWDVSRTYVDALDTRVQQAEASAVPANRPVHAPDRAVQLARALGCTDPHRAKPSVGEATRVFLRRRPARLVLQAHTPDTRHLNELAQQHGVPVTLCPELPYATMALIEGDDA